MEKFLSNFQYQNMANFDKTMLGDQGHSPDAKNTVSCLTKVFFIKVTITSWAHQSIYLGPSALFYQVVHNCEPCQKINKRTAAMQTRWGTWR